MEQLLEGIHLAAVKGAGHVQPVLVQGVPRSFLQVLPKHHGRQLTRAWQRPLILHRAPVVRIHCTTRCRNMVAKPYTSPVSVDLPIMLLPARLLLLHISFVCSISPNLLSQMHSIILSSEITEI